VGKKRDYRPVTVKEDGEEEKEREQLSGVCGINKSTTELQGGVTQLGIAASRDSGEGANHILLFYGARRTSTTRLYSTLLYISLL
jgi:hypothetical protein